ncbi:hypothetical protein ES705_34999 [subsurface metagenome]
MQNPLRSLQERSVSYIQKVNKNNLIGAEGHMSHQIISHFHEITDYSVQEVTIRIQCPY